jgi:hypothetical protein
MTVSGLRGSLPPARTAPAAYSIESGRWPTERVGVRSPFGGLVDRSNRIRVDWTAVGLLSSQRSGDVSLNESRCPNAPLQRMSMSWYGGPSDAVWAEVTRWLR